jgi:LPS export ABC transporter protein LptC
MRYSGILFLALAIVIAVASTWLHNLWREKEVFTSKLDTSKVDYYLSDFSLYTTDSDGNNRFTIKGEHFVHQRSSKKSEIYKPTISVNNNNDTLNIVAEKAEQNAEGEIKLIGKVSLQKPENEETTGFSMLTSDLVYSPANHLVSTEAEVILKTTDGSIISAIGMSEDLNTQTTRLKSNVHAEYTPATHTPDAPTDSME